MKKILIVDDEQVSLLITEHILSTAYQTYIASSGEEALKIFDEIKPDMVLSDIRMPGMSGLELQSALFNKYKKRIPFMFMTADKDDASESKGFENGAMDYIRKPYRADVLLRRVDNILQTVDKLSALKSAAQTDGLTGLLNKSSSAEEIDFMCHSSQGVLMIIDLDSFKLVNDIYGHDAGDRLLIRFADILRSAVRHNDVTGRIGGDEFIAFCLNVTEESILADKARAINEGLIAAAKEIMGEDMNIPLGASIGCVFAPDHGSDYASLFKKADKALYSVKHNGKHGYCIYREDSIEEGEKTESISADIGNMMMILGERNREKGAFVLSFDDFRLIFRFLNRVNINYKRSIWMVMFTLVGKDADSLSEEFLSVLRSSLRQSDIVTESSKGRFLVLLLEMDPANIEVVIDRIMSKWASASLQGLCDITYELELLK